MLNMRGIRQIFHIQYPEKQNIKAFLHNNFYNKLCNNRNLRE